MKKFYLMLMIFAVSGTIATAQHDSKEGAMDMKSDEPVGVKVADGMLYGKDYDRSFTVTEFTDLMKEPSANYDKTVMVKHTTVFVAATRILAILCEQIRDAFECCQRIFCTFERGAQHVHAGETRVLLR